MAKKQESLKKMMPIGEFAEFILAQYEKKLQKLNREFRQWSQQVSKK